MSDIKPEVDSVEYSQRETIQQQNDRNHEVVAANTVIKFQVASVAKGPADAVLASWIANGSFLVVLALGPVFGSLSDRVGKKWFMVCGTILGLMGGIIAGKAENIHQIIGGNILSGAANAGCIVSISAIQEIMPNRLRLWAVGFSQAMASAFVVLGTFLAATFVKTNTGNAGGWRWAYIFNGIIYGITAVAVGLADFPPRPRLGRHKMLNSFTSEIDYIGILLMSGSFASLVIGISWGGNTYAWSSEQVIGTLAAGCTGLIFGIY
ncbi:hypothetical protein DID88_006162 [Monilinia fructigena]|uniref:Major facilitator superfamily (MFS) profile domain-containing protein n=1 Tax=Monilinia fructigena TaxID=38457 RepID=A0A395J1W9_9HELO|nr:hypothetical protein DID88_006162 [Monilinia fructigena]